MASKKYIKDYEVVESEDEQGRVKKTVVYHGDYFTLPLDESQIRQTRLTFIILVFAVVALHIAAGFVGNPGMYKFYQAVPYTSAFLPLLFLTMGVFRLPSKKRPYRKEEIGLSYGRIKSTSLIYLILAGVAWLGGVIFLILSRPEQGINSELIFLALTTVSLILAGLIYKKVSGIAISIEEKPTSEAMIE